jgi:hypothetical protein
LISYIGEHGVVHSAGEYLSELETPKEVLRNPKFQSQSKEKDETVKDKKQKERKKKIVDVHEKQGVNIANQKKDTQQARTEQVTEDYYQSFLQEFIRNNEQMELKFPKSISAYDRKLIHEAASKLNLVHISVGEGSDRYIVVHKAGAAKTSPGNINIIKEHKDYLRVKVKEQDDFYNEKVQCSEKHAVISSAEQSAPEPNELGDMKETEYKKSERVGKKSRKKQEHEDFDSVIAEFQEMDKRCVWSGCRIATDLVGLTCIHCKRRFCISHGFPEAHGCGEAARKTAKHEFRHPKPAKPDPLKRSAISKKLEKKLTQMAEERKHQKKVT